MARDAFNMFFTLSCEESIKKITTGHTRSQIPQRAHFYLSKMVIAEKQTSTERQKCFICG